MGLFVESEGDVAIIVERGLYRQVQLYTRDGYLYARIGSGFVRINADGSTTRPTVRLDMIDTTRPLGKDRLGRLCTQDLEGFLPLTQEQGKLLLPSA